MENDVYDVKKLEEENTSKEKKIEISYYQARFTQKCGAILLDFVLFVLLSLALFVGIKSIVEATPYFQEINQKYDEARLNSSLYIYNKDIERVEDIVTYLNRNTTMSASNKETFLVDHINDFFDSLPNDKDELIEEYRQFLLDEDRNLNGVKYFVEVDGEVIKNPDTSISINDYIENVYKPYIDNIGLAQFIIKTPNVIDYQRYQSNMLIFLEIPLAAILGAIIIWYIIPVIFWRGKKTLGRLAFRTGLLGKDNMSLKLGTFTIRFLIFFFAEFLLSVVTFCIPLIISLTMSGFSKKKQNFHDYMLNIREVDTYGAKIYKDKYEIYRESAKTQFKDFKLK